MKSLHSKESLKSLYRCNQQSLFLKNLIHIDYVHVNSFFPVFVRSNLDVDDIGLNPYLPFLVQSINQIAYQDFLCDLPDLQAHSEAIPCLLSSLPIQHYHFYVHQTTHHQEQIIQCRIPLLSLRFSLIVLL